MDYAERINRLAGRLRIMGIVFGLLGAVIFFVRQISAVDFMALLAVALLASGATAAFTGEHLLRLIRKHPDIDQQTF